MAADDDLADHLRTAHYCTEGQPAQAIETLVAEVRDLRAELTRRRLTDDERALLACLADVWNRFINLPPPVEGYDIEVVRHAVNVVSAVVAARVAARTDPAVLR